MTKLIKELQMMEGKEPVAGASVPKFLILMGDYEQDGDLPNGVPELLTLMGYKKMGTLQSLKKKLSAKAIKRIERSGIVNHNDGDDGEGDYAEGSSWGWTSVYSLSSATVLDVSSYIEKNNHFWHDFQN